MADVSAEANKQSHYNGNFVTPSALHYRLDTKDILDSLQMFLKGERIGIEEKDGKVYQTLIKTGNEKANNIGTQSIMSFVSSIVNSAVVQGNFDDLQTSNYVYNCRLDLTQDIVTNRDTYGIDGEYINLIINFCMNLIEPYISRLKDNKERESYTDSLKTNEVSRVESEKRSGLFAKG